MDQTFNLPAEAMAGPYGFLVVFAGCIFYGLREWRRGRELDVEHYRRRAEEAEARVATLEDKIEQDVRLLNTKIESLQVEIRQLRESHFREVENVTAKYYAARQMLVVAGFPSEEIP